MKRSIFATVGTTSFDDFVRSLCSLQFLTAMANHHYHHHTSNVTSCCLPPSNSEIGPALHNNMDIENNEPSLDITIQYGKGLHPVSYIPQSLLLDKSTPQSNVDADEGILLLSIPIRTKSCTEQTSIKTQLRCFRFQPSLIEHMEHADIIICHAGAGTLLEALSISTQCEQNSPSRKRKIINAVINSKLMDNHQSELADELELQGRISVTRNCASEWTTDDGASAFWEKIRMPYVGGRTTSDPGDARRVNDNYSHARSFQQILDEVMSVDDKHYSRVAKKQW